MDKLGIYQEKVHWKAVKAALAPAYALGCPYWLGWGWAGP